MEGITQDRLIEAVMAAQAETSTPGDGAYTFLQLRDVTGWGETRLRRHLRKLHDDGRVEVVRYTTHSIDGHQITKPAYRLLDDMERTP